MPNPFIKLGGQVQSKEPQEHRPEPIAPIPESYEGVNNPWRGTEDHGVAPTNTPAPPGMDADTKAGIHYMPPEPEHDPIPVYVVNEYGKEMRKWRVYNSFANPSVSVPFIGRNMARTSLYIKNTHLTESVWIAPEPINNPAFGYLLEPLDDITLNTQDDVHVYTDAAEPVAIQAVEFYTIEV